ncbi:MAG: haloacid dehalogenase type II [Acetobacteraceae bacterium]
MTQIRALLFDTFGTVVDWRGSLIDELTAFGQTRGISADWVGLVDAWRAAYKPSMDQVRSGAVPWMTLDALHRAALDRLVHDRGIKGLTEADRVEINLGWHRLRPWPDSVPGLTRLHSRFVLGPLSNGNVALLVDMARNAGLPWDMVFGSDVSRHFKPDPEAYLAACHLLSLEPGQVMLCAAHNDDLAAAQALGLRTAFIARPTEHGPHQHSDLEATGAWDYATQDMGDLADQLGA